MCCNKVLYFVHHGEILPHSLVIQRVKQITWNSKCNHENLSLPWIRNPCIMLLLYSSLGCDIEGNVTLSPFIGERHFLFIEKGIVLGQESTYGLGWLWIGLTKNSNGLSWERHINHDRIYPKDFGSHPLIISPNPPPSSSISHFEPWRLSLHPSI